MAPLAIGYVRVSSEQQAGEKQTSLADQRAEVTALAQRLGVHLVQWFEDAGFSGASVAKRPALRELIAYCGANPQPAGAPGHVLVLNDSRFGRFDDPDEAAHLRFALKGHGWLVRFAEADDIADPSLRHIMRAVGGAQASEYRRNLRANTTRGRIGTTRQGYWASREPFGYRRAVVYPPAQARVLDKGVPKARGEKIKLVAGPADEVEIVREIFARYVLQGESMRAVCRWLNATPAARVGRQPWAVSTLRALLENRTYLGEIAARRRTAVRMQQGDYARSAPEYVVPDAHPALIERGIYERAQELLGGMPARGHAHDYRVRGLVLCPDCGEPFVGGGLGGNHLRPERRRFYIDRGARDGKCPPPAGTVSAHLLEEAVINALGRHLAAQLTPDVIRQAIEARVAQAPARQRHEAKTRRDLEQRRARLLAAVETGTVPLEEVSQRLAELREHLAQLERATTTVPDDQQLRQRVAQLVATAQDWATIAAAASGPELRTLLHPWVERLTFDRHTRALSLTLRTLAAVLVPHVSRAKGGRKQTASTVTVTTVIGSASSITAAQRRRPA